MQGPSGGAVAAGQPTVEGGRDVAPIAQLGYSSSLRGYGVTTSTGDLSEQERTAVLSAVVAQVDFGVALPDFPTPAEVAAIPARLVFAALPQPDDGRGPSRPVWWHTAPAGRDESGRPGNVFVHIVVGPPLTGSMRPVQLWGARWWARPFGADAVAATTLPLGPLPVGPTNRKGAVQFLLDPSAWRLDVIGVVLDAVVTAQRNRDRATVVLGVADTHDAAQWVAALSFLLPPTTAAHWCWSLRERASEVPRARSRQLDLVCVPLVELDLVDRTPQLVVLTTDEDDYTLGTAPVDHVGPGGQQIPSTPFSELTSVLLSLGGDVDGVLALADKIAASVGRVPAPWWPLAAAMAQYGETYAVVAPTLLKVLSTSPPEFVADQARWAPVVALLERSTRRPAADLWPMVETTGGAFAELMWKRYILAALDDDEWLRRPQGSPSGAHIRQLSSHVELDALVTHRVGLIRRDKGEDELVRALRLLDFAMTEGWSGRLSDLPDDVEILVETQLADITHRPDLRARLSGLSATLMRDLVRRVVGNVVGRQPDASSLDPEVLAWFYPDRALPDDRTWTVLDARYARHLLSEGSSTDRRQVQSAALGAMARTPLMDADVPVVTLTRLAFWDGPATWRTLAALPATVLGALDERVVVSALTAVDAAADLMTVEMADFLEMVVALAYNSSFSTRVGLHSAHKDNRMRAATCLRVIGLKRWGGGTMASGAVRLLDTAYELTLDGYAFSDLIVGEIRAADTVAAWTAAPLPRAVATAGAFTAEPRGLERTFDRMVEYMVEAQRLVRFDPSVLACAIVTATALTTGPRAGLATPADVALERAFGADPLAGQLAHELARWWARTHKEDRVQVRLALVRRMAMSLPLADKDQLDALAKDVVECVRQLAGEKKGLW
ncbi:hypothetical protein V3N99_21305 [Dermatophilaceae bacterium Soc4.6]